MSASPESLIPQSEAKVHVVGGYVVGKTIGEGFFAKVKRVEDMYHQVYALKCFDKTRISKSAHSLAQVEKEINALRLCSHPNVVGFHEVLEVEDTVYLVMEYVPHGELFNYIKSRGSLPEPEGSFLAKQIVRALDYCHKRGIVHRDIKPENILIDADNNVKIVDFGLATFYTPQDEESTDSTPDDPTPEDPASADSSKPPVLLQTQCGSPHYAAPEVLLGLGYYGPSADVWSLGVLLYAMITGNLPFTARTVPQLIQKIVSGVYKFPPTLSRNARSLIMGMLKVNPKERFSLKEILEHPWFADNEGWLPPVQVAKHQKDSAPKLKVGPSTTAVNSSCRNCGRRLNVRTDAQGRFVLSGANAFTMPLPTGSRQASASIPLPDSELCRCVNPMWTNLTEETKSVDGSAADATASAIQGKSKRKYKTEAEIAKMAPSPLEVALVQACETGDIRRVREILYDSTPCPVLTQKNQSSPSPSSVSSSLSLSAGSASPGSPSTQSSASSTGRPGTPTTASIDTDEVLKAEDFTDFRFRGACACADQQHRIDLRSKSIDNWTALHYAARKGHAAIVEELIISCLPLDLNAATKNGWTALMMAADQGHAETVELLLKYRADIKPTSTDGKTAIFLARESNHTDISQRLTEASASRLRTTLRQVGVSGTSSPQVVSGGLGAVAAGSSSDTDVTVNHVAYSFDKDATNKRACLAAAPLQGEMFKCCEAGDVGGLVKILPRAIQFMPRDVADATVTAIRNGTSSAGNAVIDIAGRGIENWTAFHYSARRGHIEIISSIVQSLINHGVPRSYISKLVSLQSKTGWSPLMMAADKGHVEVVRLLLELKADPTQTTTSKESALSIALAYPEDHFATIVSEIQKALNSM